MTNRGAYGLLVDRPQGYCWRLALCCFRETSLPYSTSRPSYLSKIAQGPLKYVGRNMSFDPLFRKKIFDRTDGRCHICRKKLCFNNYGVNGARGSWHVEHSKCQAHGGTNHGNNLYAACITCNLQKGTLSTRAVRSRNGYTRAPLSQAKKESVRETNTWLGGAVGAATGAIVIGTGGAALLLGSVGALIGNAINPEK